MIQGLLGGVVEERKTISHLIDHSPTSSTISSPSSSLTSAAAAGDQQQNLRCPRCDSTNTKFCYYNNYNLTQPRHFCKTCRRYWTKGGALRNVPIGGGCRKTKAVPTIAAAVCGAKPAPNKAKPPANGSDLMLRSGLGGAVAGGGGMDSDFSASSPLLWASPHTSHLMGLLRSAAGLQSSATHRGLNLSSPAVRVKEDRSLLCSTNATDLNAHALSLDPLSQLGLGASPWKNHHHNSSGYSYQQQLPQSRQLAQQNGNNPQIVCEMPSSEIQDLYQKFKSSSNYYNEPLQTVIGNANGAFDHSSCNGSSASSSMLSNSSVATTSSATTTTILDPIPQLSTAGEFGFWNNYPSLAAWSDLPTPNGAFH